VKDTKPREAPSYQVANTILFDKDMYPGIRRRCPREIPNPITIEKYLSYY